jgi:hypothetical protein
MRIAAFDVSHWHFRHYAAALRDAEHALAVIEAGYRSTRNGGAAEAVAPLAG